MEVGWKEKKLQLLVCNNEYHVLARFYCYCLLLTRKRKSTPLRVYSTCKVRKRIDLLFLEPGTFFGERTFDLVSECNRFCACTVAVETRRVDSNCNLYMEGLDFCGSLASAMAVNLLSTALLPLVTSSQGLYKANYSVNGKSGFCWSSGQHHGC